jgi:hypothetical protein
MHTDKKIHHDFSLHVEATAEIDTFSSSHRRRSNRFRILRNRSRCSELQVHSWLSPPFT